MILFIIILIELWALFSGKTFNSFVSPVQFYLINNTLKIQDSYQERKLSWAPVTLLEVTMSN